MSDEIDIHEPEHDHLLDHEFHDDEADDGLESLDPIDQEGWDDDLERLDDM